MPLIAAALTAIAVAGVIYLHPAVPHWKQVDAPQPG
jgi:hypothetical protein